eukprot:1717657-Rhodomonas_salina.1
MQQVGGSPMIHPIKPHIVPGYQGTLAWVPGYPGTSALPRPNGSRIVELMFILRTEEADWSDLRIRGFVHY